MQKNLPYHKQLDLILEELCGKNPPEPKKSLLLHACCGPCSSYVIEYLSSIFDITIFFYNPNIHPETEYTRRLTELKKFLTEFPDALKNKVKLVVDNYNVEDYFSATNVRSEPELQNEPERGERCRRCYEFRMRRAYDYACKNGFDYFTTTLSISPHKDSKMINEIGKLLEQGGERKEGSPKFLPSDFKKRGGFLRSTQLSEEYGLWRQDYCGCVYSQARRG
ncbi:epoxyqueuosine reductase QueH [Treponema zioleckii]|uniref:epoxyqueuosine reductase QueH n=1 Tax=Treponema zioleckii TaxID=331680 RepID=UPI00168A5D56|nr:epoxyqueuosine reductase QueH [Treponema zioleckii]